MSWGAVFISLYLAGLVLYAWLAFRPLLAAQAESGGARAAFCRRLAYGGHETLSRLMRAPALWPNWAGGTSWDFGRFLTVRAMKPTGFNRRHDDLGDGANKKTEPGQRPGSEEGRRASTHRRMPASFG